MVSDLLKICPSCSQSDKTSFSKCRFCGTKYDTNIYNKDHKSGLVSNIILGFFAVLFLCGLQFFYHKLYSHPTAAEEADMPSGLPDLLLPPIQVTLSPPQIIELKGCKVTKLASYVVTARIIASSYNWPDPQNDISPVDLGLGWDFMADKRVTRQFFICNGGRHLMWVPPKQLYRYYPEKQSVEPGQIYCCSANTHIMPANDQIRKIIESLHRDQVVKLTGALVNVTRADGLFWNTSLSRDDVGEGGCEIMYVENVQIY